MNYENKYLNCLCSKRTTVSQFITNACLQLIIVIIQLFVCVVILIEYLSLVRAMTYITYMYGYLITLLSKRHAFCKAVLLIINMIARYIGHFGHPDHVSHVLIALTIC